jgi:hypothetical protein
MRMEMSQGVPAIDGDHLKVRGVMLMVTVSQPRLSLLIRPLFQDTAEMYRFCVKTGYRALSGDHWRTRRRWRGMFQRETGTTYRQNRQQQQ